MPGGGGGLSGRSAHAGGHLPGEGEGLTMGLTHFDDDSDDIPTAIRRLRASGWTIAISASSVANGRVWWVAKGRNGGARIGARGSTAVEAWGGAMEQARAL